MRTAALFSLILATTPGLIAQIPTSYHIEQGFVAHEWGTFTTLHTSVGRQLAGLHVEEVPLPPFVYNVSNTYRHPDMYGTKGVVITDTSKLANVTVKMETPVIYFYNPGTEQIKVDLDVYFNGGSITQWYPKGSAQNLQVSLSWYGPYTEDYSNPHKGFVKWQAEIAPHGEPLTFTNKRNEETEQWIAPRATESDFVCVKVPYVTTKLDPITFKNVIDTLCQTEKFLFYRGIGQFESGLKAEFNTKNNIVLTNRLKTKIPYILIYEKKASGEKIAWWSGALDNSKRVVFPYSLNEKKFDTDAAMSEFKYALVKAGLYTDEAAAMLDTWKHSYFEHPGLKVFWILPPELVDETLPIRIAPLPRTLKRVLVGRLELMTPEFEDEIKFMKKEDFEGLYSSDRFYDAYKDLRSNTFYSSLTEFDSIPVLAEQNKDKLSHNSMAIFPNPVVNLVEINTGIDSGLTQIVVTDLFGSELLRHTFIGNSFKIDVSALASGVYYLQAILPGEIRVEKKIVKN